MTAPIWLWGLLALAVPLALHLYGRRPGRTVKLGTLRDIPATRVARTFALRVEDHWRLLLRCSILALVGVALAGPLIPTRRGTGSIVLVSEAVGPAPLVDSLRGAGATAFRLFEHEDAWSGALRAAEQTSGPVHIIGGATVGELGAARPSLPNPVQWHRVTPGLAAADSVPAQSTLVLTEPLTVTARRRLDAAIAAIAAEAGLRPSDLVVTTDTSARAAPGYRFTLTAENVASADLPFRLAESWLAPQREQAIRQLLVPLAMAAPVHAAGVAVPGSSSSASRWLLALAAILLLAERAWALRASRVAA